MDDSASMEDVLDAVVAAVPAFERVKAARLAALADQDVFDAGQWRSMSPAQKATFSIGLVNAVDKVLHVGHRDAVASTAAAQPRAQPAPPAAATGTAGVVGSSALVGVNLKLPLPSDRVVHTGSPTSANLGISDHRESGHVNAPGDTGKHASADTGDPPDSAHLAVPRVTTLESDPYTTLPAESGVASMAGASEVGVKPVQQTQPAASSRQTLSLWQRLSKLHGASWSKQSTSSSDPLIHFDGPALPAVLVGGIYSMAPAAAEHTANTGSGSHSEYSSKHSLEVDPSDVVLGERIGMGSYGQVFRASWNGADVAVKQLALGSVDADAFVELNMLDKIGQFPHIVPLMGMFRTPQHLCLVLQFMPNGSVLSRLDRASTDDRLRPTTTEVVRMALQTTLGLRHLHSKGVVHRDLACRNLLLDDGHNIRVADFGLSRYISGAPGYQNVSKIDEQQTQTLTGPLKWMSPESLEHRRYSFASDVFMFGMVLVEMMTCCAPWPDLSPLEAAFKTLQRQLPPVPDDCDAALVQLHKDCCAFDPGARPKLKECIQRLRERFHELQRSSTTFAGDSSLRGSNDAVSAPLASSAEVADFGGTHGVKELAPATEVPAMAPEMDMAAVEEAVADSDTVATSGDPAESADEMPPSRHIAVRVGSKVRVSPQVQDPTYYWGKITHDSVGCVVSIDATGDCKVDFPLQIGWVGRKREMEALPLSVGDRVKPVGGTTPRYGWQGVTPQLEGTLVSVDEDTAASGSGQTGDCEVDFTSRRRWRGRLEQLVYVPRARGTTIASGAGGSEAGAAISGSAGGSPQPLEAGDGVLVSADERTVKAVCRETCGWVYPMRRTLGRVGTVTKQNNGIALVRFADTGAEWRFPASLLTRVKAADEAFAAGVRVVVMKDVDLLASLLASTGLEFSAILESNIGSTGTIREVSSTTSSPSVAEVATVEFNHAEGAVGLDGSAQIPCAALTPLADTAASARIKAPLRSGTASCSLSLDESTARQRDAALDAEADKLRYVAACAKFGTYDDWELVYGALLPDWVSKGFRIKAAIDRIKRGERDLSAAADGCSLLDKAIVAFLLDSIGTVEYEDLLEINTARSAIAANDGKLWDLALAVCDTNGAAGRGTDSSWQDIAMPIINYFEGIRYRLLQPLMLMRTGVRSEADLMADLDYGSRQVVRRVVSVVAELEGAAQLVEGLRSLRYNERPKPRMNTEALLRDVASGIVRNPSDTASRLLLETDAVLSTSVFACGDGRGTACLAGLGFIQSVIPSRLVPYVRHPVHGSGPPVAARDIHAERDLRSLLEDGKVAAASTDEAHGLASVDAQIVPYHTHRLARLTPDDEAPPRGTTCGKCGQRALYSLWCALCNYFLCTRCVEAAAVAGELKRAPAAEVVPCFCLLDSSVERMSLLERYLPREGSEAGPLPPPIVPP